MVQPGQQDGERGSRETLTVSQILNVVAQFEALSQRVVECFGELPAVHMRDAYSWIERARKRLAIVDAEYLAALAPEIPSADHRKAAWLAENAHISRAEAKRRISCLGRLRKDAEPFTSASEDGRMPALREKVADGVVGGDAVQKIDKAVKDMPETEHARVTRALDEHVSEVVAEVRVDDLGALSHRLRAMLGIDDPYTDEDRQRLRGIKVGPQRADGMSRLSGVLTPRFAAMLKRLQADHARPGGLLEEGAKDERNPEQRFHDALEAAVAGGYGKGAELKPVRGTTSIVTVAHISDIAKIAGVELSEGEQFTLPGTGKAVSDAGVRLSVAEAIEQVVAGNSFLQVLGDKGQSLFLGRSQRLGTMAQYLALCGEEGGSSAPGKATPPAMCDMHHIQSWAQGGPTDISNLTFVDSGTHRKIDDARRDSNSWWTVRPDELASHGAASGDGKKVADGEAGSTAERVMWVEPRSLAEKREAGAKKSETGKRRYLVNQDPSAFDNPGRWLRRAYRRDQATGDRGSGEDSEGEGNSGGQD